MWTYYLFFTIIQTFLLTNIKPISSNKIKNDILKTEQIFFPDQIQLYQPICTNINIPKNQKFRTDCIQDEEQLIQLIRSSNFNEYMFQSDKEINVNNITISNRNNMRLEPDDIPVCSHDERYIFPIMGENTLGEWRIIVNAGEFKQGIRQCECIKSVLGQSCNSTISNVYVCQQNHHIRYLQVIINGNIVPDAFAIPSCCSCIENKY